MADDTDTTSRSRVDGPRFQTHIYQMVIAICVAGLSGRSLYDNNNLGSNTDILNVMLSELNSTAVQVDTGSQNGQSSLLSSAITLASQGLNVELQRKAAGEVQLESLLSMLSGASSTAVSVATDVAAAVQNAAGQAAAAAGPTIVTEEGNAVADAVAGQAAGQAAEQAAAGAGSVAGSATNLVRHVSNAASQAAAAVGNAAANVAGHLSGPSSPVVPAAKAAGEAAVTAPLTPPPQVAFQNTADSLKLAGAGTQLVSAPGGRVPTANTRQESSGYETSLTRYQKAHMASMPITEIISIGFWFANVVIYAGQYATGSCNSVPTLIQQYNLTGSTDRSELASFFGILDSDSLGTQAEWDRYQRYHNITGNDFYNANNLTTAQMQAEILLSCSQNCMYKKAMLALSAVMLATYVLSSGIAAKDLLGFYNAWTSAQKVQVETVPKSRNHMGKNKVTENVKSRKARIVYNHKFGCPQVIKEKDPNEV